MGLISYARSGNAKRFYEKIKIIAKDNNRSANILFMDAVICTLKYKTGWSDYLNYRFYLRTRKERKEYVSIGDQDKFYEKVSPSAYKTFFTIKPNFLNNFKKWIPRDYYVPELSENELKKFLKNNKAFMEKPLDGLGGHNVSKKLSKDIKDISEYRKYLKENNLFIEEFIIQHHDISSLAKNSVNSLRIMTVGKKDDSKILFAALRVGNGKNNVDNFHQGGMGILVDLDTGKLIGNAIDKDNNEYDRHPVSKIVFDGFQIPNWDYIKKMVLEAAKVNQNIHVVGWDVAITEEGATFIEGNRRPGFDLVQVLADKGRKDILRDTYEFLDI